MFDIFHCPYPFFLFEYFSLYHTAKFFATFAKRIVDYFYHKRAVESQLSGLYLKANNFDLFFWKPFEMLLPICNY